MAMSAKQKAILNKLGDYLPELRKGQLAAKDGGDIKLGDMLAAADPSSKAPKPTGIAALGTTANLTAIAGSYADLAAARASVNTLRTDAEARLDAIEAKLDALIAALKV